MSPAGLLVSCLDIMSLLQMLLKLTGATFHVCCCAVYILTLTIDWEPRFEAVYFYTHLNCFLYIRYIYALLCECYWGMFINFSPQSWLVEASFYCTTKCRIINWVLDTGYITKLKAPAEVCNSCFSRQHSASLCVFSIISSPDKLSHHPIITPNMSPATDICWLGVIKLLGRRLGLQRWICWYFWCWWGFYHRGDCGKMFSSLSSHFSARPSSHFTLMIADVKSSSDNSSAAGKGRHVPTQPPCLLSAGNILMFYFCQHTNIFKSTEKCVKCV